MSNHLKAYNAPKSWTLLRKVNKWTARPNAGAHPLVRSMPIALLMRQLGIAKTAREIRNILNEKNVSVDGKVVKDPHYAIGFMDVIHIKPKKTLRCTLDLKGRLTFIDIADSEATKKVCKITGKRTIEGAKIQLNLSDGRNILAEKGTYAVGDSLVIELPSQKIISHFALAKGAVAFLLAGRHTGVTGTVENLEGDKIQCKKDKETFETLKAFAFVIGKDKPAVKL